MKVARVVSNFRRWSLSSANSNFKASAFLPRICDARGHTEIHLEKTNTKKVCVSIGMQPLAHHCDLHYVGCLANGPLQLIFTLSMASSILVACFM